MIYPLLHIARFQHLPHEGDKVLVLDPLSEDSDQHMVIKAVEAGMNVSFDELCDSRELLLYLLQCRVTAPFRAEPMRGFRESRLVDAFEDHPHHFLN